MNRRILSLCVLVLLTASACSAEDLPRIADDSSGTPNPSVTLVQSDQEPPHSSVAEVVERVLPSVVNVKVKGLADVCIGTTEGRGEGSGVVIDPKGIILTNNHVIAGAVEVEIFFPDGRDPVAGRVIGRDPGRDLAVVSVEEEDLEAVPLGRSGELKLGDGVIAIGFPLGLGGPTVTQGIVSGLNRKITASSSSGSAVEELVGLLQTDAAINPGNSGGALIATAGNLVGINTAAAQPGSAENIGFAIAIDEALPVIEEIIDDPPEERAWLGVQLATIDSAALAAELGLDPEVRGAAVVGLISNGPAEGAGIQEDDVIVAVEDIDIQRSEDITEALRDYSPGDEATVTVARPSGEESIDLELGEFPVGISQLPEECAEE